MFEMFEIFVVLRDKPVQETEHVRFYFGVGIFIYCQAAGRVLCEKHANSVAGFGNTPLNLRRYFDHFLSNLRVDRYLLH